MSQNAIWRSLDVNTKLEIMCLREVGNSLKKGIGR
jgi:hypothetical protein